MYLFLANTVLSVHIGIVFFVVLTVPMVFIGKLFKWRIVHNIWLRSSHLLCIVIVAFQSWLGIVCPLTTLEMWLRKKGNSAAYSGSFIEHWMQHFLYWNFPAWVFISIYTFFALLVLVAWVLVPPKKL